MSLQKCFYCLYTLSNICCHSVVLIWFVTAHVGLHLQVKSTSTFMCQLDLLLYLCTYKSLLPQSCVNKVDYCLYVLANHRWHNSVSIRRLSAHLYLQVTATMKLTNIWLQKNRSPNFPKRFLLSPNLLCSSCYHNTVAIVFIVLSLHLQLISTTMLFKQAYGFLLSIHLQVLVTTVQCL